MTCNILSETFTLDLPDIIELLQAALSPQDPSTITDLCSQTEF